VGRGSRLGTSCKVFTTFSSTLHNVISSVLSGVKCGTSSELCQQAVLNHLEFFSKVVRAVVYRARALGINVFSYLDDTLTFDLSFKVARQKSYQFADLLTEVGFLLRKDKSVREPTQCILFLGFIIDSVSMTLEIPHEKFLAIQELVREALEVIDTRASTSLRFLAKVVGKLVSVGLVIGLFRLCIMITLHSCFLIILSCSRQLVTGKPITERSSTQEIAGTSVTPLRLPHQRDVARLL
jgi:hypothetical protein